MISLGGNHEGFSGIGDQGEMQGDSEKVGDDPGRYKRVENSRRNTER